MYFVLGLGIQSRAIVEYLLKNTYDRVVGVDPFYTTGVLSILNPRWDYKNSRAECIWKHSGKPTTVISCLPTQLNPEVAEECASRGWGYVDLGGNLGHTMRVIGHHNSAINNNSTIVPDCGVAPGLVSSIIGTLEKAGAQSVNISCGGLPLHPNDLWGYIKAFNAEGLYKEYTGVVECRKDGEFCLIPTLSERSIVFDRVLGILESEPTSGSISLTARESKLHNLSYKTIRYQNHWDYVKKNILWQPNPVEIIDQITKPLSSDNPDLLLLVVQSDICLGNPLNENCDPSAVKVSWRWDYDHDNNIGAMAQITGYTVAAIATLIHTEKLNKGVVHMHDIDFIMLRKLIEKMPKQFNGSY